MKTNKQWEKYLVNRLHNLASRKFDGVGELRAEETALIRGVLYCMEQPHLNNIGEWVMQRYVGLINDKEYFPREKESGLE